MPATLPADVYQDDIALSLARVMALANTRARSLGVDVAQSLISITQHPVASGAEAGAWRVSYGPRNYIGRRGGDVIIDIEPDGSAVLQVLVGQ